MHTAAIILIGNELLSGKVQDTNAVYLTGRLRQLGVQLRRVVTVPDEPADIIDEVRRWSAAVDHVFTSGGVGPTHDDITMVTLAAAFDVPVYRDATVEAQLRAHFGKRLTDDHLRMADLPTGIELIHRGEIPWPVFKLRNLYILPGIPELFRLKFETIAERFRDGEWVLRSIYLNVDEGRIAALLRSVEAAHGVAIGSYPRLAPGDHRLRITVEARAAVPVNAAIEALLADLPADRIVRVDDIAGAEPAGSGAG